LDPLIKKYFQVLGISIHASLEETKQAYKDLARVWHPDRFIENPRLQKKATEKLKEINIAYEKLLSFYENKNKIADMHLYPDATQEEVIVEQYPEAQIGNTGTNTKDYSFLAWITVICVLVILTIIVIIHLNKRPESNTSSAILMPDQIKSSKSDVVESSTTKPTVHGKPSVKTTTTKMKNNILTKKEYFTLGSTTDDVLAIQGTPTQISGSRWSYGFSYVDFEAGLVVRWYNSKLEPLHIKMAPLKTPDIQKEYFTLGSTTDDVLAIQGTPTQISGSRWSYGFSYVDFEAGLVVRWYNSRQDPLLVEEEP
jgi:hypothetical protein